jgi:hypothetical protein
MSKDSKMTEEMRKTRQLVEELFIKIDMEVNSMRNSRNLDRKFSNAAFIDGLASGLFLGLLGNLSISLFIKTLETMSPSPPSPSFWVTMFFGSMVVTTFVVFLLGKALRKSLK